MRKFWAIGAIAVLTLVIVLISGCGGSPGVSTSGNVPAQAGKAAKLVFIVQPGGAKAGHVFTTQPEVAIEDDKGNIVTSSTAIVTLSIIGPVFSGKPNVAAVNGVAKFTELSLDQVANGYSFTATSYGLEAAISNPFNVEP